MTHEEILIHFQAICQIQSQPLPKLKPKDPVRHKTIHQDEDIYTGICWVPARIHGVLHFPITEVRTFLSTHLMRLEGAPVLQRISEEQLEAIIQQLNLKTECPD